MLNIGNLSSTSTPGPAPTVAAFSPPQPSPADRTSIIHVAPSSQTGAIVPQTTFTPHPQADHPAQVTTHAEPATPPSEPLSRCDTLAANPMDNHKHPSAPGVSWNDLKYVKAEAIAACEAAIAQYPDTPRFKYQLARSIQIQAPADAEPLLAQLVSEQYAAAYDNYGWVQVRLGHHVKESEPHFRLGAAAGNADAMLSLAELMIKKRIRQRYKGEALNLLYEAAKRGNSDAQRLAMKIDRKRQSEEAIKGIIGGILGEAMRR